MKVFCIVVIAVSLQLVLLADPSKEPVAPSGMISLEAAFEIEGAKQLGLAWLAEPPTELELLKQENVALKKRVADLEQRMAAIEATLAAKP